MKKKLGLIGLAVWMLAACARMNSASTTENSPPESAAIRAKRAAGVYFSSEPQDNTFFVSAKPEKPGFPPRD